MFVLDYPRTSSDNNKFPFRLVRENTRVYTSMQLIQTHSALLRQNNRNLEDNALSFSLYLYVGKRTMTVDPRIYVLKV